MCAESVNREFSYTYLDKNHRPFAENSSHNPPIIFWRLLKKFPSRFFVRSSLKWLLFYNS